MFDIIIVGAGTAGMTAAVYASRAGASVLMLENKTVGGQITSSPKVENYPGIMQMSGTDFAATLFEQAVRFGAEFDLTTVTGILRADDGFTVLTEDGEYSARSVIIASGVQPKKLGLEREDELTGEGVCYCSVCDGAFFAGETVAVMGGGNSALTDALFLSTYCETVYLIVRSGRLSAEQALIDQISKKSNIELILGETVTELIGTPLSAVRLSNRELPVKALFVAIGHQPNNQAFSDFVSLDKHGFIISGEDCKTSTEGIFAAGDCRTKAIRQLTTATADGATAALAAVEFINKYKAANQ